MHDFIPVSSDYVHPIVKDIMKKANGCPKCRAKNHRLVPKIEPIASNPRSVVTCGECGHVGPLGKGLENAVKKWNKPAGFLARLFGQDKSAKHPPVYKPSHNQTGVV